MSTQNEIKAVVHISSSPDPAAVIPEEQVSVFLGPSVEMEAPIDAQAPTKNVRLVQVVNAELTPFWDMRLGRIRRDNGEAFTGYAIEVPAFVSDEFPAYLHVDLSAVYPGAGVSFEYTSKPYYSIAVDTRNCTAIGLHPRGNILRDGIIPQTTQPESP